MAYKHGVYTSEVPTSIIPAVNSMAGLPVIIGTAPVHLAADRAPVNKPVLCYSYAESVQQFGYSDDWENYTLCEAIYSQFALYNVAPVVIINVLDPATHKEAVSSTEVQLSNKTATISAPVLLETLKVKKASAGEPLVEGTDYEVAFDDNGALTLTVLADGQVESASSVWVEYDKLSPEKVKKTDIIGGISLEDGSQKGLEALNRVFPLFGLVPGMVLAPGWSQDPEVAAVMKAKASNINNHFKAIVLVDVPTDNVKKYTDVSQWKNQNNYTGEDMAVCWPMVKMGGKVYHMSTHLMGVIGQTDAANDDIPYVSPSNKSAQINGTVLKDGTEVIIGPDEGAYLNGQGIITCMNFMGGWKIWGNRTGCYPSNTDPKDAFLCIRRMFNWHAQTFIQTYWVKVDSSINKRLIQTVLDSENIRLNGLVADDVLLGGRVEFHENENPKTDTLDGIIKFHTYLTPPTPARVIENVIEYDPSYFETLFS